MAMSNMYMLCNAITLPSAALVAREWPDPDG